MIRLALRVRRADAGLVLAELVALAPNGFEEVDVSDELVEYAVYGAPGELPELPALRAAAGGALVEVQTREVADDWAERWREFHRPLVLGERLCVRPPWEPPRPGVALDIVIDPGRAFGTGAHATTRLCLELLLGVCLDRPSKLSPACGAGEPPASGADPQRQGYGAVDLGCGSGVLAIAAVLLGHSPVLALDNDPVSVEVCTANAAANGVGETVEARRFDLRAQAVPAAPVVLANLLAPLLRDWCDRIETGVDQVPGLVIASGLLITEADSVAARFSQVGLLECHRMTGGEWAALLLRSEGGGVRSGDGP